jgi:hypothetical protein
MLCFFQCILSQVLWWSKASVITQPNWSACMILECWKKLLTRSIAASILFWLSNCGLETLSYFCIYVCESFWFIYMICMCVISFFYFLYKSWEFFADCAVIYIEPRHWIVSTNLVHKISDLVSNCHPNTMLLGSGTCGHVTLHFILFWRSLLNPSIVTCKLYTSVYH